jgi:uncharacterized cupin superfamily protein
VNVFEPIPEGGKRRFGDTELGAAMWGGTLYELAPGGQSPYHWQFGEEEWLLVAAGSPTLRTPDGERVLRPWDLVAFPRGERGAHQLRNETDEPVRAVFFSSVADPEVAVYPDEEKTGVVAGWSRPEGGVLRGWVTEP